MSQRRVGVCSWSLRPEGPAHLVERVRAAGVDSVQLALDPLRLGHWSIEETRTALEAAAIRAISGMMRMSGEDYSTIETIAATGGVVADAHWPANRAAAAENARLARRLGIGVVSLHAGRIPRSRTQALRGTILTRVRELVELFAAQGVGLALETGQENSATLLLAVQELDHPMLGVNFDPGNLILYGTDDPVDALTRLAPRVFQVHVKDARPAPSPGKWGEEVAMGEGKVNWPAMFEIVRRKGETWDLVVERSAREDRLADIQKAFDLVRDYLR